MALPYPSILTLSQNVQYILYGHDVTSRTICLSSTHTCHKFCESVILKPGVRSSIGVAHCLLPKEIKSS